MVSIVKATIEDYNTILDIGIPSFFESHQSSASKEILETYINKNFTEEAIKKELSDSDNIFHIIYYNNIPAGYSKIIFGRSHSNIETQNITKLERIYLLKEFYSLKLGYELFKFNLKLSQQQQEKGMWLFVWDENERAIQFYKRAGFKIVGSHDFYLSTDHSNPNHQMFLKY